jgi:hypothetical protein
MKAMLDSIHGGQVRMNRAKWWRNQVENNVIDGLAATDIVCPL